MESGETPQNPNVDDFGLRDNSRIAVIGGGPAVSSFSHFLLAKDERVGTEFYMDIYESRNYTNPGPPGCNI